MDAVSYAHSAKQAQRIERFIEDPDSNSGIVTVPKVIATGETITIPSGRVAVLPNVQVDGTVVVEAGGEIFVPAGAGFSDLDQRIDTLESTKQDNLITNDPAVKTALNATGSAPIYACRAWVNFNGTGTVAIRGSGNVSSIIDNGVGNYTVNFTTAMPDANYSMQGTSGNVGSFGTIVAENIFYGAKRTNNSITIGTVANNGVTAIDDEYTSVSIFR